MDLHIEDVDNNTLQLHWHDDTTWWKIGQQASSQVGTRDATTLLEQTLHWKRLGLGDIGIIASQDVLELIEHYTGTKRAVIKQVMQQYEAELDQKVAPSKPCLLDWAEHNKAT